MRRHKSLIPLSHDHHHCLVIANKLSIYLTNPESGTLMEAVNLILDNRSQILEHFHLEEKYIFPKSVNKNKELDSIIAEIKQEHIQFKELYDKLSENKTHELINSFSELMENHVRKEERILFQLLQENLSESELKDISKNISSAFNNSCTI